MRSVNPLSRRGEEGKSMKREKRKRSRRRKEDPKEMGRREQNKSHTSRSEVIEEASLSS